MRAVAPCGGEPEGVARGVSWGVGPSLGVPKMGVGDMVKTRAGLGNV